MFGELRLNTPARIYSLDIIYFCHIQKITLYC